jgi:hypothetical protein
LFVIPEGLAGQGHLSEVLKAMQANGENVLRGRKVDSENTEGRSCLGTIK